MKRYREFRLESPIEDFPDNIQEQFPKLHLSIVHHYYFHLHRTCDLTTFRQSKVPVFRNWDSTADLRIPSFKSYADVKASLSESSPRKTSMSKRLAVSSSFESSAGKSKVPMSGNWDSTADLTIPFKSYADSLSGGSPRTTSMSRSLARKLDSSSFESSVGKSEIPMFVNWDSTVNLTIPFKSYADSLSGSSPRTTSMSKSLAGKVDSSSFESLVEKSEIPMFVNRDLTADLTIPSIRSYAGFEASLSESSPGTTSMSESLAVSSSFESSVGKSKDLIFGNWELNDVLKIESFKSSIKAPLSTISAKKTSKSSQRITSMSKSLANAVYSFNQVHELKNVIFMVPRVKKFAERQYRIKKYQLLEFFISFLLQLLYHKTDSIIVLCKDRIENLEKELRFLHTVLGDTSLMLCADAHEEFQNLLAEFVAVANEAGNIVYLIFFAVDQACGKIDEGLAVVLGNVDLLKTNLMKFLDLVSSTGRSACMTPRTCVVDSLVFLDSLTYYLEDLVNQDKRYLIADVKDHINTLRQGLTSLRSSIKDTGLPQPLEIGELKENLMRIGDMVSGAEHLIIAFLVGDAPRLYLINRLSDINNIIELTRIELQEITRRYKFEGLETGSNFIAQLSLQDHQRNSDSNDIDVVIGLEDQTTEILEQLIGENERLKVISICGMPGVGKTTLAKKLYDHPYAKYHFDKLAWCVISQEYQKQSVLTDILTQLTSEPDKNSTLAVDEHVHKSLKGRRYLIVMDDVWDSHVWDDLLRCFPDDGNGSRILFTTRDKDVALGTINFALHPLSNDQCWELLEKKVFNINSCPHELLGIGKEISANCHGLPLLVVVIAGVLSTLDKKKSVWEDVGRNLASYIFEGGENSVMNILELSYKHLPDNLKPCFLYFGAFKKDGEIPVSKLTRLWVAEGFVHEEGGKSAENVAKEYLIKLIDKSLVIVAKTRSDGGVKACVVHDLLRDMCLKKCEDENFMNFVKKKDCYSIYGKGHRLRDLDRSVVPWIYCQHLRSFRGHILGSFSDSFYVRDLRLLRVLHFDYIRNHYIGIEYLLSLRYLVVNVLPASIGSLVNLEYLRVETSEMVILHSDIMKMMKLRYIHVYNPDRDTYASYGGDCDVDHTNNLKFLSVVFIANLRDEEMLRCSPHLHRLKCIYETATVSTIEVTQHFDFSFLTQLVSLSVRFRGYVVLAKIIFPSSIKKLTLSGNFIRLWDEMSTIGRLENLEVLKLRRVSSSLGEDNWDTSDGEFQKLRFLEINHTDLCRWNVASTHFPKLQQLILADCFHMEEISPEIGGIATLQLIEVRGRCPNSLVESARGIQREQLENGNDELRISHV